MFDYVVFSQYVILKYTACCYLKCGAFVAFDTNLRYFRGCITLSLFKNKCLCSLQVYRFHNLSMASVSLENQLHSAQKNLLFLQQDHASTLKGLHAEVRRLQQHCTGKTMQTPPDKKDTFY